MCVHTHTHEGQGGGITDDILIGLGRQMPACEDGQSGPDCNCVSVARHGFRSPLAPLRAPTGIRCSSVVLPPLLTRTHKRPSSLPVLPEEHSEALSTPVNLRQIQIKKKPEGDKGRACFVSNLFILRLRGRAFSAAPCMCFKPPPSSFKAH